MIEAGAPRHVPEPRSRGSREAGGVLAHVARLRQLSRDNTPTVPRCGLAHANTGVRQSAIYSPKERVSMMGTTSVRYSSSGMPSVPISMATLPPFHSSR
jgi:hypothetical protein